jgi:hypothetical protein
MIAVFPTRSQQYPSLFTAGSKMLSKRICLGVESQLILVLNSCPLQPPFPLPIRNARAIARALRFED